MLKDIKINTVSDKEYAGIAGLKRLKTSRKSITGRWIVNNIGIILIVMLVLETFFIYAVQTYYYNSAKQYMTSKVNAVTSVLSRYSTDSSKNFSAEVRNMVESFSDKDKMELMVINSKGRVVLTSSGFSPDNYSAMPDVEDASENLGLGHYVGTQPNGEKIMAVAASISSFNAEYSALRVVISLSAIDEHITSLIIMVTLGCLAVIMLLLFSGFYFVGSIVKPIQQISMTAGKFAKGDFSERIVNDNRDEIGDLCTAINHMADELSSAEAMKNEFISSVSHELRTPLTAIKGWAETLSMANDPETTEKGIRVIISETERLSQMVEELLDFSRMQSGRFNMQKSTIDILAEIEEAVLIYGEKAKHDNIEIIYNAPEMLPFVMGDKNRLRQVFINVIDNAIKYSNPDGTVTVEATSDDEAHFIQIVVADNGCGISKADLPKVKTKFFKANHTRRGSGIGLAVADEIISMHKGTLTVMSEENVGTTVVIRLPAIYDEQKAKEK